MRIIAGRYKKTNLFSVPGKTARPTTDYLKEVIFSVLYDCADKKVLDLFAGSGALGLEALSRGAEKAVFVDFSDKAIKTIKQNIRKLKCEKDCRIYKKRVSSFLMNEIEKFDLIFLDPPYDKNLVNSTIELIFEKGLLKADGKIIVEHSKDEKISEELQPFVDYEKESGRTIVTILTLDKVHSQSMIFQFLTPLTPLCKRGETLMNAEYPSSHSPLSFPKRGVGGEFKD